MARRSSQCSYLSVKWIHTFPHEPILILAELDKDRMEQRKIEYFQSKAVGLASRKLSRGSTQLSEAPIPTIAQINSDAQFLATEIEPADFEAEWEVDV